MLAWPMEQKQPSVKKRTGKDTNQIHFIFGISHLSQYLFFQIPITTHKCLKEKKKILIFTGLKVFQRLIFYFFADTLLDVEEPIFNTKGNCKERISDIGLFSQDV